MNFNVSFNYIQKDRRFKVQYYRELVKMYDKMLVEGTGEGHEYLGWLHYASTIDPQLVEDMINKANEFRDNFDTLVVCGIGGSYLGSRAVIEAINGLYSEDKMEIVYLGHTLDSNYTAQTLKHLEKRNYCVCVISKSGTTTETSIAFRILKERLEKKLGKEGARKAIVAITDKENGALRQLSIQEGYTTFELPANIGGRYSVISPVGLFPMAVAGINIKEFIKGFVDGEKLFGSNNIDENPAYQYACQKNVLYSLGYKVEFAVCYEPRLAMLNEWAKQLFDESNGKEDKGLLIMSSIFTTDLHSIGQFIQEGSKILFETVLTFKNPNYDLEIPYDEENLDGMNYIAGKKLSYVCEKAHEGTTAAHAFTGNVPNISIEIDELTPESLGTYMYFCMKACAMGGYLLGINPFNQPGVEVYKRNMFHLLGKKGY